MKYSVAVHGGAGTILKKDLTPEQEKKYKAALQQGLDVGFSVLEEGGSAVAAVKAACISLEDNALFNAGKGSVFTKRGIHEMDAAIMDGKNLAAGAVAGVRNIRNPVELAEQVMLHSGHVFLSGEGANEFALQRGIKLEPFEYFFDRYRYEQWMEVRDSDVYLLDHNIDIPTVAGKEIKMGTIGAVACDKNGNVAAATSTGGMTNKQFGRIGIPPL